MNFIQALKKLNIEDYEKDIINSNSHGELFHLQDYIAIAEIKCSQNWFREFLKDMIEMTNKSWERPKSVFQHIIPLLEKTIQVGKNIQ